MPSVLLLASTLTGGTVLAQESSSQPTAPEEAAPAADPSEQADKEAEARQASEEARAAFLRGNTAFQEARYLEAAEAFEEAFALRPHAAGLFNAAKAYARAHVIQRAADLFSRSLKRDELAESQASEARLALEELRKQLGWVELTSDPGTKVNVGDHRSGTLPLTAHLTPGKHRASVTPSSGAPYQTTVTVKAGQGQSVVLEPPQEAVPVKETPAVPKPVPAKALAETSHPQRTWGFIGLATGGVFAGAAIGLGIATLNAKSAYRDGGYTDESQRNRTVTLKTSTNIAAAMGAAAGIAGGLLLFTARPTKEAVAFHLTLDQLLVAGSF